MGFAKGLFMNLSVDVIIIVNDTSWIIFLSKLPIGCNGLGSRENDKVDAKHLLSLLSRCRHDTVME